MTSRTKARIGQGQPVNASGGANGASNGDILVRCACCLKTFHPKSRSQRFCGARCRMLAWALKQLLAESRAGRVEGLRGELRVCLIEILKEKTP